MQIPIEISARHIHLSEKDLAQLFGAGYQLKILRPLSQPGLFAAEETVTLIGPKGQFEQVRVIGPCREQTQAEVSITDSRLLGIAPPVRISGDLTGSVGIKVIGPKGEVNLREGVIIAKRHLHVSAQDAKKLNLKNGENAAIKIEGSRGLIFQQVEARVSKNFKTVCHLDTDEGNAADIKSECQGELIK